MRYQMQFDKLSLDYCPETLDLTVSVAGSDVTWSWTGGASLSLATGQWLHFAAATCESREHVTGVARGVKAVYTALTDEAGKEYPYLVETFVGFDLTTGDLKAEVRVERDQPGEISALVFPPRFAYDAAEGEGYTVLPRMQGTLVPAGHPIEVPYGIVYERNAYIPMFGQIKRDCGYTAIYDTPFDARYELIGEDVRPHFVPSLGTIAYKRVMRYIFFTGGDFNTMAKQYRAYLSARGELVTLREKIARNPRVAELIGLPIVHGGIAARIHPKSMFYNHDNPEANDRCFPFASMAEVLRDLKKNGAEKVYLHLDGWGHHGYDNLHPDVFPIHERAGGAEGMRGLMNTCHELGYLFGIHDQYRDYYYDAPTFSLDNAVTDIDGGHPYHDVWFGGPHTFLCATLAEDYVRRNYNEFERLGIHLDGSYLDVFSVVTLDECFNPDHLMTREQCAASRRRCLDILTDRGIIPSSEEVTGCTVNSMVLCHHAPFYTTDWEDPKGLNVGVPIPLLNLVYHDCVVIPWFGIHRKGAWGVACTDRGFYWALLCGNTIYYDCGATAEEIEYGKVALELNRRVAHCQLVSHEILDGTTRRRRSTFSDGTVVEADFDGETFAIRYPDGRVVEGK